MRLWGLAALFLLSLLGGAQAQSTTPNAVNGCIYVSSLPTLSSGQQTPFHCDANGKLLTTQALSPSGTVITGCSDKQILFDDAGLLGCNSGLTFDKATGAVSILFGSPGVIPDADGSLQTIQNTSKTANDIYSPFSASSGHIFDGLRGVTDIEPSSGIYQADGIAGYIYNNVSNGAGAAKGNAVAVYGLGVANKDNSSTWGANFVASDTPGTSIISGTNRTVFGVEADTTVNADGSIANGVLAVLQGQGTPSAAVGFQTLKASAATWTIGFASNDGAAGTAFLAGASAAAGASVDSQPMALRYYTSGSVEGTITMIARSGGWIEVGSNLLTDQLLLAPGGGGNSEITVDGSETDINLILAPKGSGVIHIASGAGLKISALSGGGSLGLCVDNNGLLYTHAAGSC